MVEVQARAVSEYGRQQVILRVGSQIFYIVADSKRESAEWLANAINAAAADTDAPGGD